MRIGSDNPSRRWQGLAFVLAIVAALCATAVVILISGNEMGAATPRDAVERFVTAAADRDQERVSYLLRRGAHPADVESAFAMVPEGAHAQEIDVQMPFASDIAFVYVRGGVGGRSWNARYTVALYGERWYIAVGEAPDTRPKSSMTPPR